MAILQNDTSIAGGARWAFFAIFIVLVFIVILGTLRVNKKRSQHGVQPLYGTRWMTPPSYRQSQNQYDQPDTNNRDPYMPSAYVPTYTATANEYDMGYYDTNGEFHPNPNAKASIPVNVPGNGLEVPPTAHPRENNATSGGVPISSTIPNRGNGGLVVTDEYHNGEFRRPPGPPPGVSSTGSTATPTASSNNRSNHSLHTSSEQFSSPSSVPPDVAEGATK